MFIYLLYTVSNIFKGKCQIGLQDENNLYVIYINKKVLNSFLLFLNKNTNYQFKQLLDISAIDYLERSFLYRFEVFYLLLSVRYNFRLLVKVVLDVENVLISSSKIFLSAGWLEREVWDMFGIYFFSHSDLRRILTDYGFVGFPLRKDFPLSGYMEVRYDDTEKRVLLEPIELTQEYRMFQFNYPWNVWK